MITPCKDDMIPPMRLAALNDMDDPSSIESTEENELVDKRSLLRRDRELPKFTLLSKLTRLLPRAQENADIDDPNLLHARVLKLDPILKLSITEILQPKLKNLRRLIEDPYVTQLTAEARIDDPIPDLSDSELPKRKQSNVENPQDLRTVNLSEIALPTLTNDRTDSEDPTEKVSIVDSDPPAREKYPRTLKVDQRAH
jgi:hypothetical protein